MMLELPEKNIRNVWQNQSIDEGEVSLEKIQQRAKASRRNRFEYIAIALAVFAFGFYGLWNHKMAIRIGSSVEIAGLLYVAYQLHKKARAEVLPEDCGFECCVNFYGKELERQRDALRSIWRWYLGPMIPGLAVLIGGDLVTKRPDSFGQWVGFVLSVVICALVFFVIGKRNVVAARLLQTQIDDLGAAKEQV
jgi:hypothetical protein